MDRVLLVIDDIQFAAHVEMTLRKVGFEVEVLSNEYNLNEKLLTFNPDYVVAKGTSARVSALNVGRKMKESQKYLGKVILIFQDNQKTSPDELIKLRMDLMLFEPISAMRLVTNLLNLTQLDRDSIMDKLVRIAQTDNQFRSVEATILKEMGHTIDSEIKVVTGLNKKNDVQDIEIRDEDILSFVQPDAAQLKRELEEAAQVVEGPQSTALTDQIDPEVTAESLEVSADYKRHLIDEIKASDEELPLRIETYNRVIKGIDQDLKVGLNKRKTRKVNKDLFKGVSQKNTLSQDEERKRFVKALVKKK